jgi:CrcB protein
MAAARPQRLLEEGERMERLLWVCLGSALGGGARYLLSLAALRWLGASFPYGTLAVNLTGSFAIGLLMHVALATTVVPPGVRIFLATGLLGGLTTYSTFNYETLVLASEGEWALGAVNLAATVLGCLLAGALGILGGRVLVDVLTGG